MFICLQEGKTPIDWARDPPSSVTKGPGHDEAVKLLELWSNQVRPTGDVDRGRIGCSYLKVEIVMIFDSVIMFCIARGVSCILSI
jgi:hypothetical protein